MSSGRLEDQLGLMKILTRRGYVSRG